MNRVAACMLTRLYPRRWRDRYGAEFEALLVDARGGMRAGLRTGANVAWSALCEHIFALRGLEMNRLPRSFGAILCAYAAVVAAGLNFYATVDDSSLAVAMRTALGLQTAWNVVALGSAVALMGAVAMLVPLMAGAFKFALREKRRDVLLRLLVAPASAISLTAWVVVVFFLLGRHWAPLPWAVAGDWVAPAGWPPLEMRWVWGSITAGLAVLAFIASSVGVYQAFECTKFDELRFTVVHRLIAVNPLRFARIPGMITTGAMAVMTVGVFAWGLMANMLAPAAVHAYSGPLHTTAMASWIGSVSVFAASSVAALLTSSTLLKAEGSVAL